MIISSNIVQKISPGLAPDVQVIEQQKTEGQINVAAYCRVSTNLDIQKQSLETQIAAFSRTIAEHPGWVLAGIYADKGISGTTVKHRDEFLRMIEDAKAGKIQYILVKSISRFARNTVDALSYVRELKNCGVSVFFDKEKLDTGKAASEFMLSILAASAQEEIISLSNNMKVGIRMRYAAGIVQWTRIYGYRKGEDGNWAIDEDEALVVRRIFSEYVRGRTLPEICRGLEADGIPATGGGTKWYPTSIAIMLHSEKYAGDLRMQKSYSSDPINHIRVSNREAKIRQYYMENHHPAIVERETFQMACKIAAMRDLHRGSYQYPYYSFLKCPICGENMVRFSHPRNNHTYAWTCGGKPNKKGFYREQRTACPPYYIIEPYIDNAFWDCLKAVNKHALHRIGMGEEPDKAARAKRMLELHIIALSKKRKIEYEMLHDLVEQISFPQWSMMRVDWKLGMTTEAHIRYGKITDEPYPEIRKEQVERETVHGETVPTEAYVVNGVPVFTGCPAKQVKSIRRAQEEVMNLVILEPKSYEPPVPHVYGLKTISESSGLAIAEENKAKRKKTEE